ncbi:MAG TPA: hypothetical protein VMZ90_03650 [Vicinamibacterales bacterium]|nr:hypothetical protein [Vicinamibacterales bacterium]
MSDFQVKSDAVDVDAIMRQIRARIREKRGADYTEAEVQELAKVKLEQFLDPKGVRSDLVAQFKRHRTVSPAPPNYAFEDDTIYETHRGPLRSIRKLLNPVLKLFFNPNKISEALHVQAKVNQEFHQRFRQREDMDPLYYELVHNLAVEVTRLGIEIHNMKMRVESVSSRMDFDERRGRALESVVQYRPSRPSGNQRPQQAPRPQAPVGTAPAVTAPTAAVASSPQANDPVSAAQPGVIAQEAGLPQQPGIQVDRADGEGERRRRRRRRRRRPGQTMADQAAGPAGANGTGFAADDDHDDIDDAGPAGPPDNDAQ